MEKVLLSVKELMEYTGWGENKVRALLKDPTMPFIFRDGTNRLQCNKRLFDKWLDSQCGKQRVSRL